MNPVMVTLPSEEPEDGEDKLHKLLNRPLTQQTALQAATLSDANFVFAPVDDRSTIHLAEKRPSLAVHASTYGIRDCLKCGKPAYRTNTSAHDYCEDGHFHEPGSARVVGKRYIIYYPDWKTWRDEHGGV